MVDRYRNYTATVYTFSTSTVKGSLVQVKTLIYSGIKIGLWGTQRNYDATSMATQTNQSEWEANLAPMYPVSIGDIFEIDGITYKVDKTLKHYNYRGKLNNIQAYLSKTN